MNGHLQNVGLLSLQLRNTIARNGAFTTPYNRKTHNSLANNLVFRLRYIHNSLNLRVTIRFVIWESVALLKPVLPSPTDMD